jgi:simple sugar transport system permease protein
MNYNKAKLNDLIFEILRTALAILISIGLVVLIIMVVSGEPIEAIKTLFLGPLTSKRRIGNIIELAIPLTFCGLAISLTFRAKQINLVSDSAFYSGAMAATVCALFLNLPAPLTILISLLAGAAVGGILGFIPAFMKIRFGAMELVTSLMLNYVMGSIVQHILTQIRDANKMALESLSWSPALALPRIIDGTRIHAGIFILILCIIAVSVFMYKTKGGYALRMTGTNMEFAHYSGIPVTKIMIGAQLVGAALAGLGGSTEILGMYTCFKWVKSPGYGFDGVIIATLARNNPAMVPFAALFLAYIRTGADILNRSSDISFEIVSVIQATIILLIASSAFLANMKQKSLERATIKSGNSAEGGVKA